MGTEKRVITIIYPTKEGTVEKKVVPWVPTKSLHLYFKELKLQARRMFCHISSDSLPKSTPPLRTSYVPKENETIRLIVSGVNAKII